MPVRGSMVTLRRYYGRTPYNCCSRPLLWSYELCYIEERGYELVLNHSLIYRSYGHTMYLVGVNLSPLNCVRKHAGWRCTYYYVYRVALYFRILIGLNPNPAFAGKGNCDSVVLQHLHLSSHRCMLSTSRRSGRPRANELVLDVNPTIPTTRGYYASADGNRVVEDVQPSGPKRRRILPQDVDEDYGTWVPVGEAEREDSGNSESVAQVVADAEGAVKRKRYESSVSRVPILILVLFVADVDSVGLPDATMASTRPRVPKRNDATRGLPQ